MLFAGTLSGVSVQVVGYGWSWSAIPAPPCALLTDCIMAMKWLKHWSSARWELPLRDLWWFFSDFRMDRYRQGKFGLNFINGHLNCLYLKNNKKKMKGKTTTCHMAVVLWGFHVTICLVEVSVEGWSHPILLWYHHPYHDVAVLENDWHPWGIVELTMHKPGMAQMGSFFLRQSYGFNDWFNFICLGKD